MHFKSRFLPNTVKILLRSCFKMLLMTDAALLFSSTTNLAVTKKCVAAFAPPPSQLVWLTNAIHLIRANVRLLKVEHFTETSCYHIHTFCTLYCSAYVRDGTN